jgi:hypothetical protein
MGKTELSGFRFGKRINRWSLTWESGILLSHHGSVGFPPLD